MRSDPGLLYIQLLKNINFVLLTPLATCYKLNLEFHTSTTSSFSVLAVSSLTLIYLFVHLFIGNQYPSERILIRAELSEKAQVIRINRLISLSTLVLSHPEVAHSASSLPRKKIPAIFQPPAHFC